MRIKDFYQSFKAIKDELNDGDKLESDESTLKTAREKEQFVQELPYAVCTIY